MYEYGAKLQRVVDGDTLDLIIDLGFKMTTEQRIRLKNIDTPETFRQKTDSDEYRRGKAATEHVIRRIAENGNEFRVRTDKLPGVYGRYIADILLPDSEETLNDELLRLGHAVAYKK